MFLTVTIFLSLDEAAKFGNEKGEEIPVNNNPFLSGLGQPVIASFCSSVSERSGINYV